MEGGQSAPDSKENKAPKKKPEVVEEKKEEEEEIESIAFSKFFSVLERKDKFKVAFAIMSALISGVLFPSFALVMGGIFGSFRPGNEGQLSQSILEIIIPCCGVFVALWFFASVYYYMFRNIAEKITYELRTRYLKALMKQEVAFFEINEVETMPSDVALYLSTITAGVGESFGHLIQTIGTFVGGVGIAFYRGPIFAMICVAYIPVMLVFIIVFGSLSKKAAYHKMIKGKSLNGFTEESLSALKLIVSFNQEEKAIETFEKKSEDLRKTATKAGKSSALVLGISRALNFGFFLYALYIGSIFIEKEVINPKTG